MEIEATEEVHSFEDIDRIRRRVREAAARARQSLRELNPDPMVALYQLQFQQQGHNPLKDRNQSLREQTYRTFTIMTILAAADHIFRKFPVNGLNLKLAQDFPSNFDRRAIIESAIPEIQSIEKDGLDAQVFAATTRPSRITSNNVLRKRFQRLTDSSAEIRLVYFYWPLVRPLPHWLSEDMENWRLQEMKAEIQPKGDLADEFYRERLAELGLDRLADRLRKLGISSREPFTRSEERKAGGDIQIWSLPLRELF